MSTLAAPPLPLADIHLHAAPSYWPLAWGWWAVISVSLVVIIIVGYQVHRRSQRLAARREAIAILKSYHFDSGLTAINALLKQAALSYFPRATIAPLTGMQWLLFLDQQLPSKYRGFVDQQSLWQHGLFSSTPLTEQQFNDCQQQALLWLQYALPVKTKHHNKSANVITKESSNV